MPFPLPIFSSTLLLERGTLITSGVFSRIKPRLGLSLSLQCLSALSSLSRTSAAPPPRSFCGRLRLPSPRKGCMPSLSLQTHTGTLPFVGFQVLSSVPRLFSVVPVLLVSVPRPMSQGPCPKTTVPRLVSQDHCPKTTVPRLVSHDHCPKTTVPRLVSQDYCPKTSVPRLVSQD